MPVVTLLCREPDNPTAIDAALHAVVLDVAAALGGEPAGTWAHWIPMAAVVQGEDAVGFEGHCPIVTIRGRSRDDGARAAALRVTAAAVSSALEVPIEDVWVQWIDVEPGHAFVGGDLV